MTDSKSGFQIRWNPVFSYIRQILKIQLCPIRNCCFGPTLQVWITVHWLMERSAQLCLLYFLQNNHYDFNYSLLVCTCIIISNCWIAVSVQFVRWVGEFNPPPLAKDDPLTGVWSRRSDSTPQKGKNSNLLLNRCKLMSDIIQINPQNFF